MRGEERRVKAGMVGSVLAWRGEEGRGLAGVVRQAMGVEARLVRVWQAGFGKDRRGRSGSGGARQASHVEAWCGQARPGAVGQAR